MSENATVLISLALQNNRRELDLQVPADRQVGELLPFFQQLCRDWVPNKNICAYSQVWVRTSDGRGRRLSLGQTLSENNVRDGDKLELVQDNGQTSNQGAWQESQSRELFHIPPRAYPEPLAVEAEIVIPLPPKKPRQQGNLVSMLQRFLPVIGTVNGSLFFVFYIISDRSNPLLLAIALISILTGFLPNWTQRRALKESQERARKAYRDYLKALSEKLNEKVAKQHEYCQKLFPPDQTDLLKIARQGTQLWVRGIREKDFLQVSMGLGKVDFYQPVSLQASNDYQAEYDEDDLQEQKKLQEKINNLLTREPIVLSLRSVGVLTLVGERTRTRSLARALLSQLVVFHSPQDLRCLVFFPPEARDEWRWLRWLPHTRLLRASNGAEGSKEEPFALLARQAEDLRWLLENQVMPVMTQRRGQPEGQLRPHILMLIDGLTLNSPVRQLLTEPPMTALLEEAATLGLTVLCLVDNLGDMPRQTKACITWTSAQADALTFREMIGKEWRDITPRTAKVDDCSKIARSLAALKLAGVQEHTTDLSRNFGLFDLLNIPPVADRIRHWRESRQTEPNSLLRVPVGRNEQGRLVYLDLKEAAYGGDGPHGLLVGAIGSGKSELLRTLILALALQHDTQTLDFVFIDFKGDATFTELKRLPHKAGLITNLEGDPGLFERVLDSLEGEVTRRERLFRDEGARNIREYHQIWQKSLRSKEPLPYLLLVVDEAAELLTNKQHGQAFRELFISIGRVGRSLGIHLLLTTQKIEGNAFHGLENPLRYRLCLRTNTKDESVAVLGQPDAFYLPSTPGIGYLKVDSREPQKMKAALVSQPLVVPQQGDLAKRIRTFTSTGSLMPIPGLPTASQTSSVPPKEEIQIILNCLLELSKGTPEAYQVWRDALPEVLGLRGLEKWLGDDLSHPLPLWRKEAPGTLQVSVGLVDLPQQQRQELLTLDFANGDGHLALVGAPQSGKSTFLHSLLMALMLTHAPSEVQIYIIDLAGGQFSKYEPLPHIGAVCLPGQDEELRLTLRLMRQIIADRQTLFRQERLTMADFRKRRQEEQYPHFAYGDVFLVIDNVASFRQDVVLGEDISYLLQHGSAAGVHLILTANDWPAIRPSFLNHIGTYLELRLIVPENSRIDMKAARALPGNALSTKAIPGRGLTGDQVQFQASQPWIEHFTAPGGEEQATLNYLKSQADKWSGSKASPLPKLPFPIKLQEIQEMGGYGLLLGLQDFTMKLYYLNLFEEGPHFQVWGDSKSGKTTLLRVCLEELQFRYPSTDVKISVIESGTVAQAPLYQSVKNAYYLTNAWIRNSDSLKKSLSILKEHLQSRLQMDPDLVAREPVQTHYVLLVDGYDHNLVKDPNNPMKDIAEWAELVTWAERGEEIGFHVILTGSYAVANSSDRLVKILKVASPGLLLSANTLPGQVLYDQRPTVQPPGRGFIVRPGQGRQLIQTALPTEITTTEVTSS